MQKVWDFTLIVHSNSRESGSALGMAYSVLDGYLQQIMTAYEAWRRLVLEPGSLDSTMGQRQARLSERSSSPRI
jgi:hypothetical protein